ncbi:MAG: hypothetical protein ACLQKH_17995 [Steroidobacteraceae bacterium]
MPTNRIRRRRTPVEPDVIAALRSGTPVAYTPENFDRLLGAYYFEDFGELTNAEKQRGRALLDAWRDQQALRERQSR